MRFVRTKTIWLLVLLGLPAFALQQAPQTTDSLATAPELKEDSRVWKDASGQHEIAATLLGIEDGKAHLQQANGEHGLVPLDSLSAEDKTYALEKTAFRVDPASEVILGRLSAVTDGDTVQVINGAKAVSTVRLEGIDAPESDQPLGDESTEWLFGRLKGKDFRVEVVGTDKYGRKLGHIYVEDRWVNHDLVEAGLARHYKEYSKDERLASAEAIANRQSRGIWNSFGAVAPWDWRKGVREAVEPEPTLPDRSLAMDRPQVSSDSGESATSVVYATKTGSKYHRSGCRHLAKSQIPISLDDAVKRYSPCSVCKPPSK